MRTDPKIPFKMDRSLDGGSGQDFPSRPLISEIIDHAIEKGGDLMARSIAMHYEAKTRLPAVKSGEGRNPYNRLNRLMDTADSRNRVVEQWGAIRDEMEAFVKLLVPCVEHSTPLNAEIRKILDHWIADLTEVLIDATGD